MKMIVRPKALYLFVLLLLGWVSVARAQSPLRHWNEVLLEAIRNDLARPNVHARNLYHWSVGVSTLTQWAHNGEAPMWPEGADLSMDAEALEALVSDANGLPMAVASFTHRFIALRYAEAPGYAAAMAHATAVFAADWGALPAGLAGEWPAAALGQALADAADAVWLADGANQTSNYANPCYTPANSPLDVTSAGECGAVLNDLNRWQPLSFGGSFVDQAGNETFQDVVPFSGANWGDVAPFALHLNHEPTLIERDGCTYPVYLDPGEPGWWETATDSGLYDYQTGFALVAAWQNHLDPTDGVVWDISPASTGNMNVYPAYPDYLYDMTGGGDRGTGHALNPATEAPYEPEYVLRGDFTRVLAEFWADGPDSETPPGHWFNLLNEVSDHPEFSFLWQGVEVVPEDVWWAWTYLALGGAMHDAAIAAWGAKGAYDFIRPISAIRHMLGLGQSTDPDAPSYHPDGIPLMPGVTEIIADGDPLAVGNPSLIGELKIRMWLGEDPGMGAMSNFGWTTGCNWWPYQRPTFVTPPFAGYVSGHSTFSRAAAEILTRATGSPYFPGGMGEFEIPANDFLAFEAGPSEGFTLQWATYKDAADQCSLSRIWGGIHPPMDDIRGRLMGLEVADNAWNQVLSLIQPDSNVGGEDTFCPEDVDEDGTVNTADLLQLLSKFGDACGPQ